MDRRSFLQAFAASLISGTVSGGPVFASASDWKASFHRALAHKPWLLGFKGTNQSAFDSGLLRATGTLPESLKGIFYRNGPARHEVGDLRYNHWFDGDGMVHRFGLQNGQVTHKGRFVQTAKFREETAAGHAVYQAFGTALPGLQPALKPDDLNVANISIIKHNGELLALWEGGSAYRLDADSLNTLGLKNWSQETTGLPFSAHPRLDRDGTLWNFGYSTVANALVLYRIDAAGSLVDTGVIRVPRVPMVHDFLITDRHIVFILPPLVFDATQEGAFLDRFDWRPEQGGRALIIEKDNLASIREIDIPAFWVFHFGNAHEESDGTISFDAPIYTTPAVMTSTFREIMRGREIASDGAVMSMCALNPVTGTFEIAPYDAGHNMEFPRIDQRWQGLRHRYTVAMQSTPQGAPGGLNTIIRIDHDSGTIASFTFGDGELAEEHVFVPKPGGSSEDEGWLLGTSLDFKAGFSRLNIFDVARVSDGPVARVHLPYPLPLGLHGNFYPQ